MEARDIVEKRQLLIMHEHVACDTAQSGYVRWQPLKQRSAPTRIGLYREQADRKQRLLRPISRVDEKRKMAHNIKICGCAECLLAVL